MGDGDRATARANARPVTQRALATWELTALMGLTMATGAFAIDIMLPALQNLAAAFGVSETRAQLVVNVYFIGFAVGQLFFGPWSDQVGRRLPLMTAAAGYVVAVLGMLVAPTFGLLLALRFVQGAFSSGLRAAGTALVRDSFRGEAMARILSFAFMVLLAAPLFAPSIGVLLLRWGWRAPFGFMAVLATVLFLWLALRVPETLPPERRTVQSPAHLWAAAKAFWAVKVSVAFTLVLGLSYGVLQAYLASAAQLVKDSFGLSNEAFAIAFALGGLAQVVGTIVNGSLITRLGLRRVLPAALLILAIATSYLVAASFATDRFPVFWFGVLLMFFAIALIFPNANSAALEPLGRIAGFASSLVGFGSTALASLFGTAIGQISSGEPHRFALGLWCLALGNLVVLAWIRRLGWLRARA
ncbi:MAG: multidrug effflux MFS transporter [Thermomicrobium sp.]|nr:multidrug effflux MFS transporter [Thermomicrobium sp.]MDW8058771.1 multidrug effflux MFS transporter [Thermomicrobium sp.]